MSEEPNNEYIITSIVMMPFRYIGSFFTTIPPPTDPIKYLTSKERKEILRQEEHRRKLERMNTPLDNKSTT